MEAQEQGQGTPGSEYAEAAASRLRAAVEALEKQVLSARERVVADRAALESLRQAAEAARQSARDSTDRADRELKRAVGAIDVLMEKLKSTAAERDAALSELESVLRAAAPVAATGGDASSNAGESGTGAAAPDGGQTDADLFAGGVKHWKILDDFPSNGGIEAADEDGAFRMRMGDPLSGIRYNGPLELPVTNYEIMIEARRAKGSDFFCGLTFPVNSVETCCTFVAGGWGGALAGISSLEGMDAANNDTSTFHKFELNRWYGFRIQVTPEALKVWMDGEVIADVELADRRVGMRWGDIEYCAPFGLATYLTTGEFRNFKVRRLDGKAIEEKRAAAE